MALVSCGSTKKLDANYANENCILNFYSRIYGEVVNITVLNYDPVYDIYRASIYDATYKIYSDSENPNQLFIEFNVNNHGTFVYTFEEGVNDDGNEIIIINGDEFLLTTKHASGYGFRKFLYDMGIIDTLE